eukprot:COSAG02_NODE_1704_length_11240_cov_9.848308_2_plen_73_part_00
MPRVKERAKKYGGGTTPMGTNQPGFAEEAGQAARSSKPQWRSFLSVPQEANAGGAVGKALTSAISLAGALLH